MNEDRLLILGNRLKLIRAEAKLKQKEFAEQLGIATTTYSGYESGKHEPSIDLLIKIADLYELSLDYVVGRSSSKGGISEDDINEFFTQSFVEPLKQEGKSDIEIMEEFYQNLAIELENIQGQMSEMRKMIDDKKGNSF